MITWIIICTGCPSNENSADSHYWIAIVRPGNQYAEAAKTARASLGDVFIVTTDEVLTEFLTALSSGAHMRKQAAKMVRAILHNPKVKVIPQTRDSFFKELAFYENRSDKNYSLTDCISMNAIRVEWQTSMSFSLAVLFFCGHIG